MRYLLLITALIFSPSHAKTSLWEVSNGTETLYLGGTIHMLSPSDFPLPEEFNDAYRAADIVVLETNLGRLAEPAMQQLLLQKVSYAPGKTLKSQLQADTHAKLRSFLAQRGLPVTVFETIKPSMVSITLSVMEMKRLGLTAMGVDQHFFQRAIADGKTIGHLETPEQQITFIANMGNGNEDALLLNTIRDLQDLRPILEQIKNSWRKGDPAQLIEAALRPMQKDYPALYQSLLVDRNNSWMPHIEAFLNTPETEIVLVGALHLVGEHGLLAQLESQGLSVTIVNQ